MATNDRDEETLVKLARAFGSQQAPSFESVRFALNAFVKRCNHDTQDWHVTRQTVSNWLKHAPPSFPMRNDRFVLEFLKFLKPRPIDAIQKNHELPEHFDKIVSRLLVLFSKRLKPKAGIPVDSSFPIYPDKSHTVKIYQSRVEYVGRDSLQLGLQGKFITLRKPIGASIEDEVSIEYLEVEYLNGNYFATWHVKIDGTLDSFKGSVILAGNSLWFFLFNRAKGGRFRVLQSEDTFWRSTDREYVDAMLMTEKPSYDDKSGAARTTLLIRLPPSEDDEFEGRVHKNTGRRSLHRMNDRRYAALAREHLFGKDSAIDNRRS